MNDTTLFSKAVSFAAEKHQAQISHDGNPYILHLIKVSEILRMSGYDRKYQITALLHKTLAETDSTVEELLFFGSDVCEAVKRLTWAENMDADSYLSDILENPIAAMVKSADLVQTMWECTVCEDKNWTSRELRNARPYCKKLCKAVDDAIAAAQYALSHPNLSRKNFSFVKKDMKLYSEIRTESYNRARSQFNPNLKPVRNGDEVYYRDEMGGYLLIEHNRFYALQRHGWQELPENPIYCAVNPLEEYPASNRSQFEAFIAQEIEHRNYFYDFVEIEKL